MLWSEAQLNAEHQINPVAVGELDNAQCGTNGESKRTGVTTEPIKDAVDADAPTGTVGRSRRKHRSRRHRRYGDQHHWSERSKVLLGILLLVLVANFISKRQGINLRL